MTPGRSPGAFDRHAVDVRRAGERPAGTIRAGRVRPGRNQGERAGSSSTGSTRAARRSRASIPELRGDELVIDTALPDTQAGRDAAVEIRDGLMRGLSVEFKALRARMVSGVRRISKSATLVAGGPRGRSVLQRLDCRGTRQGPH